MSTALNCSICLTDLVDMANKGHSAFTRSEKNGKIYVNVTMWINDEPDQYQNNGSFQLNPHKDKKEADVAKFGKCYVGNAKYSKRADPPPVEAGTSNLDLSGFPGSVPAGGTAGTGVSDDLPF